jgi:putative thioredoxin
MTVFDVDEADFEQQVIERSRDLPVVVDFWADWCGPCKQLTPALERAAQSREGKVDVAKVDVDKNQGLAARYGVQGIPSVKAFRDGVPAAEFTGALPPAEVERFFDALVPSEVDELVARGDEESLRRALELEPRHIVARRALGALTLRRGQPAEALELLEPSDGDFIAEALAVRARLTLDDDEELMPAFEAWDEGDYERALELLQEALASAGDSGRRDQIRKIMIGIFTQLGPDHPLAREHRRRLSSVLF